MSSPPRASGLLSRPDGHQIYWEESGRADGLAALYLHGDPVPDSARAGTVPGSILTGFASSASTSEVVDDPLRRLDFPDTT